MTEAAQHHCERCEAEIRLRFTATGGKEEKIDRVTVRIARIRKSREIEQNESELKCAPARRLDGETPFQCSRNRAIGDTKRIQRVRVLLNELNASSDASGCDAGEAEQSFRRVAPCAAQLLYTRPLPLNPVSILRY